MPAGKGFLVHEGGVYMCMLYVAPNFHTAIKLTYMIYMEGHLAHYDDDEYVCMQHVKASLHTQTTHATCDNDNIHVICEGYL